MNETQDSASINTEDQLPPAQREGDCCPGYEEKLRLRPESAESTDLERIPKSTKAFKTTNRFSKSKPQQNSRARRPVKLIMNVSDTQYPVVRYVGKTVMGWRLTNEPEGNNWDLFWTDNAVQPDQLGKMKPYQKINHFPGMYSLAQKNHLGRNLMRMQKAFPLYYDFFPQTWVLPAEFKDFKAQFNQKGSKTFIVKPAASCQGRGIFLTRTWENINENECLVAQRYLLKPLLIDGLKFDLRIYVLLAGSDPLRIYMHEEGLARFATVEYSNPKGDNLKNLCMHLTNYAINKENPNFVFTEKESDGGVGHKRTLTSLWKTLEELGHDTVTLKAEIKRMIVKTFCSVQPVLAHHYRSCQPEDTYNNMCFEILGFDVLLDHKLKPWLIEVNHTPSFATDTPLDHAVKQAVISDALKLMDVSIKNRLNYQKKLQADSSKLTAKAKRKPRLTPEQRLKLSEEAQLERDKWESQNCGKYIKLYPLAVDAERIEPYEDMIQEAQRLYEAFTGTTIKRNTKKETTTLPPFRFNGAPLSDFSSTTTTGFSYAKHAKLNETGTIRSQSKKITVEPLLKQKSYQDTDAIRSQSLNFCDDKLLGGENKSVNDIKIDSASNNNDIKVSTVSTEEHAQDNTRSPLELKLNQGSENSVKNNGATRHSEHLTINTQNLLEEQLQSSSQNNSKIELQSKKSLNKDDFYYLKQFNAIEKLQISPLSRPKMPKVGDQLRGRMLSTEIQSEFDMTKPAYNCSLVFEQGGIQRKLSNANQITNKSNSPVQFQQHESPHFFMNSASPTRLVTAKSNQDISSGINQPPRQENFIRQSAQFIVKKHYSRLFKTQKSHDEGVSKYGLTTEDSQAVLKSTDYYNGTTKILAAKGNYLQPKLMNIDKDGYLKPEVRCFRIKTVSTKASQNNFDGQNKLSINNHKTAVDTDILDRKGNSIQEYIKTLQKMRHRSSQKHH